MRRLRNRAEQGFSISTERNKYSHSVSQGPLTAYTTTRCIRTCWGHSFTDALFENGVQINAYFLQKINLIHRAMKIPSFWQLRCLAEERKIISAYIMSKKCKEYLHGFFKYIFRYPHLPTSELDKLSGLELDRFIMIKAVFSFNENTCFHINQLSALFHNASKCCGNFSTEIRRLVRRQIIGVHQHSTFPPSWWPHRPTSPQHCAVVPCSCLNPPDPGVLSHQRSTFYSIPSAREV